MIKKITIISLFIICIIVPFSSAGKIINENNVAQINDLGDPLGNKGILAIDIDAIGATITLDGNLTDWENVSCEVFNGITTYLAFDSNYVYVAAQWEDHSFDDIGGKWNKTGMFDADDAIWDLVDGSDDVISVGFGEGLDSDIWVWTTSNRTMDNYAYETDLEENPDTGTMPFILNSNDTTVFGNAKPLYDNYLTPLTDYAAIPIFSTYNIYIASTASGSQTDVNVATDWNQTKTNYYTVEFKRALNTGNGDDIALDFTSDDIYFYAGIKNKDAAIEMSITVDSFLISTTNEAAQFIMNSVNENIYDALLISGQVYDDFIYQGDYRIEIRLSGWDDTYGPNSYNLADINHFTGQWSYIFYYDEFDMPLGYSNLSVIFYPRYEEPIMFNQTINIQDIDPPNILGIVNINDQYPDGVPYETDTITITVGVNDNYDISDNLYVELYFYHDDSVAMSLHMFQYIAGGLTFTVNMPVLHDENDWFNYTYWVQVWDTSLNKASSVKYWFITEPLYNTVPPTNYTPTITLTPTISVSLNYSYLLISAVLILSTILFIKNRLRKAKIE
ncbi:MAG: hypothetical protein FK734_08565 [Asgard group archaeon]|nr:hypothetical protein [Asgard group archaeon]